jgi:DNA-binding transcriptional MerR regulator
MSRPEIRRLYYSMKEVCRTAGITAYALKSWEKRFPQLKPAKNKSGKRLYKPADVEVVLKIRDWMREGTPDLEILRRLEGVAAEAPVASSESVRMDVQGDASKWIEQFRRGLQELLELLK